jgi:hypothetical protein
MWWVVIKYSSGWTDVMCSRGKWLNSSRENDDGCRKYVDALPVTRSYFGAYV